MACGLCQHDFSQRRRANCIACTQAELYHPRLLQVKALLSRESTHAHAEAVVRPGNDGVLASLPQTADWDTISAGIKVGALQRCQDSIANLNARLSGIVDEAVRLKKRTTICRDEIEARRHSNQERRADLDKKRKELEQYRTSHVIPAETAVRKTRQRLERLSIRSADAKAHLCFSVSNLLGLKPEMDVRRRASGRTMLAGLAIPDLREITGPPVEGTIAGSTMREPSDLGFASINASLTNICRLIAVWTHYLTISVPAEIILPHHDFPHAGLYHERSSYTGIDPVYPGVPSHNTSPTTSRVFNEVRHAPRPRIFTTDRPLSKIAKEDPKTFELFVEGVALLAWDVAWLCRTQGIASIDTFDDMCDIGRNLWLLHRAAEVRVNEAALHQAEQTQRARLTPRASTFGKLTHGTILHSLNGHEGAVVLQSWRLAQPQHLAAKLKSTLLSEMAKAEWDVLSDKDFDDPHEDEAVMVGGNRTRHQSRDNSMSMMSVAPLDRADTASRNEKGWMKLRDRAS